MQEPSVAFIIPAHNEAEMLPSTLDSITRYAAGIGPYEVIVVDNLSTDGTGIIAAAKGARVVYSNANTIGKSRNLGAGISKASTFIFLDADITLTAEWSHNAPRVVRDVAGNPFLIGGSDCRIADSTGWVAKTWFDSPNLKTSGQYIGSAHLIMSRLLFEWLGGFDESLKTGEDYDICSRARMLGAKLAKDASLKVIHHGVPRSPAEFFKREMWHGLGDAQSVKALLKSKVAVTALAFTALHLAALFFIPFSAPFYYLSPGALLSVAAVCLASAVKKFGLKQPSVLLKGVFLYYLYYWGRSLSVLSSLTPGFNIPGARAGRDSQI